MSKSTTGAYGDFPDYYYDRGNQFSSYLGGRTPRETWDQRMEKTLVPDAGPIVRGKPAVPAKRTTQRAKPKPTKSKQRASARVLTSPALAFARSNLSLNEIRNLAVELGKERGVGVERLAARDPIAALSTALAELSAKEEQRVLDHLRARSTTSTASGKPRPPKPANRRAPRLHPREKRSKPAVPTHCSVCSGGLSDDDIAFVSQHRAILFGHGYCRPCAGKMLSVLGSA